jgi:hypothetical protein
VGNLRFVGFQLSPYWIYSGIWVILHFLRRPLAVFRTLFQASTVRGAEWEVNESEVCLQPQSRDAWSWESYLSLHCFSTDIGILLVGTLLNIYDKNILKIDSIHSLICFYGQTFPLDLPASFDLFTKRPNKKEEFGHKWWTLWYKSNIYCGTGIPSSEFWWRSKVH